MFPVCVSKHNSDLEKQVILLMIWNGEWLSGSTKSVSIIKRNYMKKNGDFYCLNCLHSSRPKNKVEWHKKVRENKDFCNVIMPSGDTKIIEFNQNQKSDKAPFVIYAGPECIIEKLMDVKIILKIHLQQK